MSEKKGAKIIPFPQVKRPPASVAQTISGQGNVGVVGDGNHVQINLSSGQTAARALKYIVQPGPQHINSAQAAEVRELVHKVAAVTGKGHAFVWSTIKRECRFSRYEMLEHAAYEQVCQYLRRWIGRYTQHPVEGAEDQRKRFLKRIHAEARKSRGVLDQVRAYILGRFGTASLADLTPGQLQEVIREFRL